MKQVHCKEQIYAEICLTVIPIVSQFKSLCVAANSEGCKNCVFICSSHFMFCLKVAQQDSKGEATLFTSSQVRQTV